MLKMDILSNVISNEDVIKITTEFSRLQGKCYLENAGAALYPNSLLQYINNNLMNNVYINPHSDKYTYDCIEQIRCMVLKHFHTKPSEYSVVFTSGTTQSLKLVAESFQFSDHDNNNVEKNGLFVHSQDNHTSVIGMREIVKDKNINVVPIPHYEFIKHLQSHGKYSENSRREGNNLLVYPAQNNHNGFKYPIDCIKNIKRGCLNRYINKKVPKSDGNWYVLLDAASYVASNKLDLSEVQPDFVCLSFYKIFGYPTGLGALLIKNSSAHLLNAKKYFGGGTVDMVIISEDFHVKKEDITERFEDGTNSFLSILALKHCFEQFYDLIPKVIEDDHMETISYHTYYLAKDLYDRLKALRHHNGNKAAVLYADSDFSDIKKQGAIVTFNMLRDDGSYIGYTEFQHMADLFDIAVRTGCFCNPGSCQRHLNFSNKDLKMMFKAGHKCGDDVDFVHGKPTGAVRVSFGYQNTFDDVDRLLTMICRCFVKTDYKKPIRSKIAKSDLLSKNIFDRAKESNIFVEKPFFRSINIVDNDTPENKTIEKSLEQIVIYPIKSCGGFKIDSGWQIGPKGFQYDREWMIVNDNGVCLTQKNNTRMCLIQPRIDLIRNIMVLEFEGQPHITLPLDPCDMEPSKKVNLCHTKVCTDLVNGYDCGDDVGNWISEVLEVSFLRLIRQSSNDRRQTKDKQNGTNNLISLSNQAQFLLINKATIQWLSLKIKDPSFTDDIDALTDRFRGNLIVNTDEHSEEKNWHGVIIGKHEFKVEGECRRCQMVCIDQRSGVKTIEPLRTISEQFSGKLRFGIYLSYVGTIDGSKDKILKVNAPLKTILSDNYITKL